VCSTARCGSSRYSSWIEPLQFSDDPAGYGSDGLPRDRELLGWVEAPQGPHELLLERIRGAGGPPAWEVSADSVAQVPQLYDSLGLRKEDALIPAALRELALFGLQLWQWVALFGIAIGSTLVATFAVAIVVRLIAGFTRRTATAIDDELLIEAVGPARLLLAVALASAGLAFLPLPVTAQSVVAAVRTILLVGGATWVVLRAVDALTRAFAWRAARHGQATAGALVAPVRRIAQFVVVIIASGVILSDFGFNVTTLIAGLGIGGIAVALAAQKSIENLFGGLTLFADQPVRIGERCHFADITGTVEDIGLRSIRIRTQERTVVSVPNGDFANLRLENLSRRDKHWFHPVLRLPHDTPAARLRAVLEALREQLRSSADIEHGTERVWLARIGDPIEIEVSAYVAGTDRARFESIAEELQLRLLEAVAEPAGDQTAPRLEAMRKTGSDQR